MRGVWQRWGACGRKLSEILSGSIQQLMGQKSGVVQGVRADAEAAVVAGRPEARTSGTRRKCFLVSLAEYMLLGVEEKCWWKW